MAGKKHRMPHRFDPGPLGWLAGLLGTGRAAEEGSFDSNGVQIHYLVQGQGDPVLLIHGFTMNIRAQWRGPGILKALEEDYRVVALDSRGHGKSGKPHDPGQYGMEMVEDVVRLLDQLQIDRAHVVGYSMGARITCKLLVSHPDRLLSATLGGGGGILAGDAPGYYEDVADSLEQGKGFGPLLVNLTPPGKPKPTGLQLWQMNRYLTAGNDTLALAAALRGMNHLCVADDQLRANRVPTLALIGASDPLRKGVDALVGRLANLEVVVIDGADHMTAFIKPQFVDELMKFLATHRQQKHVREERGSRAES
jgi:pimeloyl-ACP methyl ester carboxylesterase